MASFRKRGPYQWQAQIRQKGQPLQTKTFETRAAAEQWSREVEYEMDRGTFVSRAEAESTTLINSRVARALPSEDAATMFYLHSRTVRTPI